MTPIEKLRRIADSTALDGVADAIREVADEMDWRPIETAPKNSVCKVGNNHYSEFVLVWWPNASSPMRARWWHLDDDEETRNFITDSGLACYPTVWQPLPPAPKGAE